MREEGLERYEALVGKTAQMFTSLVGIEVEDLRQELRIRVVKAKRAYDPARSQGTEEAFVYGCLRNFVKDLQKARIRRAHLRVEYIEDHAQGDEHSRDISLFELRYAHVTEEEVYAFIARFTWPSTVTEQERKVAALLVMGFDGQGAANFLGLHRTTVAASLRKLREKLADWRPAAAPESNVIPLRPTEAEAGGDAGTPVALGA